MERDRTGLGRFLRGKLVAITGSNGKTTTTALLAHILQTSNIPTLVGGNIGTPLLALVERSTDPAVTVAEISSFQLETIDKFRPEIGVLLNLTPDHLDRHGTFEEYAQAKMRMFENQLERDMAVLNADDPEVTKRMPRSRTFSGSAGRNEWPPGHSCATTKSFSATKVRKRCWHAATRFRCAANTTWKMF